MKKKCVFLLSFLLTALVCGCDGNEGDNSNAIIDVAFENLSADGSAGVGTTKLMLKFSEATAELTADDITLSAGDTGAVKGELSDKGFARYELSVKGIEKTGKIGVGVTKSGYEITPSSLEVTVYYGIKIGDIAPGGGIIFYINPDPDPDTDGWKCMEVAPARWYEGIVGDPKAALGYYGIFLENGEGIGAGKENTDKIIAALNSPDGTTAAELCRAYRGGGMEDWYLPSSGELQEMYHSVLTQGKFAIYDDYWSSSDINDQAGVHISFDDGNWSFSSKSADYYVRPARRF